MNTAYMATPAQALAANGGLQTVAATATTPERKETTAEALQRLHASGRIVLADKAAIRGNVREYSAARALAEQLGVSIVIAPNPVAERESGAHVVIPRADAKNLQKVLAYKADAAKAGVSTRIADEDE